jgi:hypothetical protein
MHAAEGRTDGWAENGRRTWRYGGCATAVRRWFIILSNSYNNVLAAVYYVEGDQREKLSAPPGECYTSFLSC